MCKFAGTQVCKCASDGPPGTPGGPFPCAEWQWGASNSARLPSMLAPCRRQSLSPPPGHANRPSRIPPGGRPSWRRPGGKALIHRRATPTGRPEFRQTAVGLAAPQAARRPAALASLSLRPPGPPLDGPTTGTPTLHSHPNLYVLFTLPR